MKVIYEAKISQKGRSFLSKEIGQLIKKGPSKGPLKGQPFERSRAIAAAFSVARKKGYKVGKARSKQYERKS